jgi:RNA-directed DNA polymerase
MTVKALMPVRSVNRVVPLAHEATAMRTTDTAASERARSGAVSPLIGASLRRGDVDCTTVAPTPGIRTSTTATRTTTTRATKGAAAPSADPDLFHQLVLAYLDCRRTKRNSASAQAFEAQLERNLCDLHDDLAGSAYRPGPSICFVVTRPRPREVWAAQFRDRVVHHLLYNQVAPRFLASFTADSCACIPGRGTLYAARRLEHQVRSVTENWARPAHYLKCDLANFFVSIDKHVLMAQLARRVTEPWWLRLTETVLMHDPRGDVLVQGRAEELRLVPPHKSLFNAPPSHGLPIGNLSSQFFANILLNELDQHVKHRIGARHYTRYVDDMVLLHESPDWLNGALDGINAFLPSLGLALNPRKTILQPIHRGIDYVGQVIKPWRRTTRRRTVHAALDRLSTMEAPDLFASSNSYLGLLRQASHSHHDRALLINVMRDRGHVVKSDLTKVFRKTPQQRSATPPNACVKENTWHQ